MSTPTTRRHPRSTSEAFPGERAYCVEVYRPRHTGRKWLAFVVVLLAGLLALAA